MHSAVTLFCYTLLIIESVESKRRRSQPESFWPELQLQNDFGRRIPFDHRRSTQTHVRNATRVMMHCPDDRFVLPLSNVAARKRGSIIYILLVQTP